jgi:hypothetical protein
MYFFKNREQEGKTSPIWDLVAVKGERIKEKGIGGEYGRNIMYSHMKMEK